MSYVRLWLADVLPRGSKNNVLQWFVQFLLGLPVPIHMSSFCWDRRCPFVGATENPPGDLMRYLATQRVYLSVPGCGTGLLFY